MPFTRIVIKSPKLKRKLPEPETLGEHIRRRREELKLYQRELAERLGVDHLTVHNWETGKTRPGVAHFPALIAFLGYDPGQPAKRKVAALLKAKRRQLGLTQREVARLLDVDPSIVGGWEADEIVLRRQHRRALARFLGLPQEQLIRTMGARWLAAHPKTVGVSIGASEASGTCAAHNQLDSEPGDTDG